MGIQTKIIGSTDLTHYGMNYGYTPHGTGPDALDWVKNENDRRFIDAMIEMDSRKVIEEAIKNHNACCAGAVATAIEAVKIMGASNAKSVAYSSSHDKSPGDSFVGYAGVVFEAEKT
jgi:AmmeMemoRadiSam system protein B